MVITRRAFLRTGVAGGLGLAGAATYGFAYERHRVSLTRANVTVTGLPAALDGVRIGILTDLHHSALVSQQDILGAAQLLMSERPDVIALLGDYVTWGDRRYVDSCIEALATLSAPLGVFAILGNHDDEHAVPRALAARGFDVLLDTRTDVRVRGESIAIAGIRFWTKRRSDLQRLLAGAPRSAILLAHDPRRLAEAADLGVPLVLSGHTHGGQIVLPLIGAVAARKYPVAQGTTRLEHTTLFVSRGVGTVFVPVRLNCPPEAAVLTLRSAMPPV
jgi:predicted MPP superfamily phosphohydrolase